MTRLSRLCAAALSLGSVSLITPHEFLFDGQVDLVDRKLRSLWANRMVLPNLDALPPNFSARGRHLQGAVLLGAILPKIDFTAAEMQDAAFNDADLREAKFACAESQVLKSTGLSNMPGSITIASTIENLLGKRGSRKLTRTRTSGATWYHQKTQQPPHLFACTASVSSSYGAKLNTFSQQ